jgi:hypothetical protein
MSYTGSVAQTGSQTLFQIKVSSTFTTIGEVLSIAQSGKTNKTADVTNLQSTAEEFIPTLLSSGKYELTMNRVPADAGQAALLASFNAKTIVAYNVLMPDAGTYTFNALVEEFEDIDSVSPTKQLMSKAGIKVSGPITYTAPV